MLSNFGPVENRSKRHGGKRHGGKKGKKHGNK